MVSSPSNGVAMETHARVQSELRLMEHRSRIVPLVRRIERRELSALTDVPGPLSGDLGLEYVDLGRAAPTQGTITHGRPWMRFTGAGARRETLSREEG